MLNEKQIKSAIRKIIRRAKQDRFTLVKVAGSDSESQLEKDLISEILACDETTVCFYDMTTGNCLGVIYFVFEYDGCPSEIVADCTDNEYTLRLIEGE